MKISNNTILITGGTSGIGLELVRNLYFKNTLIIVSQSNVRLKELQSNYPKIHILKCDLCDTNQVKNLITNCVEKYPEINILINNAGIELNYSLDNKIETYNKIEDEIKINFTSPMILTAGLIPLLKEKKESAIVNVSSGLIYAHKKSAVVYSATKSALHAASISLREQLSDTNIKVFEVIPPLVDTPLTAENKHKKISTKKVVQEFINKFEKNQYEINIGITKLLKLGNRILPELTHKLIKRRNLKS